MDKNEPITFEDTSDLVDRSIPFWDNQSIETGRGPIIPRKTPWKPNETTPPNFTRTPRSSLDSINQDSNQSPANDGNTGVSSMDSKTERFLWILGGTLAVTILVFSQRDFVISGRVERIKKDVEFCGKANESTRNEMKSGMDSWVKLFSAQQQTNNLLTQGLLDTKESVGTLDKKVSVLGAKTETIAESAKTLDRTAQSMSELLRSFSSEDRPRQVTRKVEESEVPVKDVSEPNASAPKVTAKSVTILSKDPVKEKSAAPVQVVDQPLSIDGIEVSLPPETPKKKFHFWNPFSWWGSEKPRTLTRSDE